MDNFITIDIEEFQELFHNSLRMKINTLRNMLNSDSKLDSDFLDCISFLEENDLFKNYVLFLNKVENNILNDYCNLYNFYNSLSEYDLKIKTISLSIVNYNFIVTPEVTPKTFNILEYLLYD